MVIQQRSKYLQTVKRLSKILGLILVGVVVLLCIQHRKELSLIKVLEFTPKNLFLAALFILLIYLFKSFLFFLPISVMYFAVGVLFPPLWGVAINTVGSFFCATVPYLIGRYAGSRATDKLLMRFPKLSRLRPEKTGGEWFFSYITRVICIFPSDVASLFLGSLKINYRTYISGSMVGLLPGILACTLIGTNITNPFSPVFLLACISMIAITVISLIIYKKTEEKNS